MARGRARWAMAVGVTASTLLALPSCSVYDQTVLVAGRDEAGTPVVGAARCDRSDTWAAESIDVSERGYPYRVLWKVGEDWGGDLPTGDGVDAPPAADPARVGDVRLIAVGDPDPDGYDVVQQLREPLPDTTLDVRATFEDDVDYDLDEQETVLDVSGEPGRYTVMSADRDGRDLALDEAVALVERICDDDGSRTVRNALTTGAIATGVVLLGAAASIVVGIRQFRRAGVANERRRSGQPPAG